MRVDGMRSAVTVTTGKVDENGGMRLRMQAEPEVQTVSIEADGDLRFDGAAANYAGDFKAGGAPATEPEAASQRRPEGRAIRLNGKFALDHERLSFDEFLFETGPLDNPYSAEGKGFVDFGRSRASRCRWTARRCVSTRRSAPRTNGGGLTLAERLAALQEALLDLPKPSIPGRSRSICRRSWPATRRSATCGCRPSRRPAAGR